MEAVLLQCLLFKCDHLEFPTWSGRDSVQRRLSGSPLKCMRQPGTEGSTQLVKSVGKYTNLRCGIKSKDRSVFLENFTPVALMVDYSIRLQL